MLAPFAPHLSEELWEIAGNNDSVFTNTWPIFNEKHLMKNTCNISIQVNGKLRGNIEIDISLSKEEILDQAKVHENTKKHIVNKHIIKEIYVPGKIINFVVK